MMLRKVALFLTVSLAVVLFLFSLPQKTIAQNKTLPVAALNHIPVCPSGPKSEDVRCHARLVIDEHGKPKTSTGPSGYGPAQFHGAYGLPTTASGTPTIAIVDAYDDPTVEEDLATYSAQFGLPTCNKSNGCLRVINQDGGTTLPSVNGGWALEISLDVQTAHAICQNCNILLVEANSNSYSDLMTAVDRARIEGAKIISNSYGSGEFLGETSFDSHFNWPGIVFTFSSGDNGYGTSYPAASKYVTSVGGTSLYLNADNSYNSESAWSGSGSGCSRYEGKPGWQQDTGCFMRTIADVSADADPNTGAAVFDSTPYNGQTGWFQVGGTSLSSPIIAGVYALSGGIGPNVVGAAVPYTQIVYGTNIHDVTVGKNGICRRSSKYLCTAGTGYDGPTGLGTPNGVGAF